MPSINIPYYPGLQVAQVRSERGRRATYYGEPTLCFEAEFAVIKLAEFGALDQDDLLRYRECLLRRILLHTAGTSMTNTSVQL